MARKKKTGFGSTPRRDHAEHGKELSGDVEGTLLSFKAAVTGKPFGIEPSLILKIHLDGSVDEETWARYGLTLLGKEPDKTLVLFASDSELSKFRADLEAYGSGQKRKEDQKEVSYYSLFSSVDHVGQLEPEDRMGQRLRRSTDMPTDEVYALDVNLWHPGTDAKCRELLNGFETFVKALGGAITDRFTSRTICEARVRIPGQRIQDLLSFDRIAAQGAEFPPEPNLDFQSGFDIGVEDVQVDGPPRDNTGGITVIDSGVVSGHPFLAQAIGEATCEPAGIGSAVDADGHGTKVCGIALYGDIKSCVEQGTFEAKFRIYSARVTNDQNKFDDDELITSQMNKVIRYFHDTYGCRVFNLSQGDDLKPYIDGGRPTPWAAILDELARELDVVIVVSAGNYRFVPDRSIGELIDGYPDYLFESPARIIEPATSALALTVGSLASSSMARQVGTEYRVISGRGQPSSFTRTGFGVGGAVKPDLCAYGGDGLANARIDKVVPDPALSVLSTSREFRERLLATGCGTSFAAPAVSYAAATILKNLDHEMPANLVRALLANAAEIPREVLSVVDHDLEKALRLTGYGKVDLDRAVSSTDSRVTLLATDIIEIDKFHVYEIPIPEVFAQTSGKRRISISLAFDPPTRHTRIDYLGTTMSFKLIRGKDIEAVVEAFRSRTKDEDKVTLSSTKYDVPMDIGITRRSKGTLQKAAFSPIKRLAEEYGDKYYLVVRAENQWALPEIDTQTYAIVVTLEHMETVDIDLYAQVQERLVVRERAAVRA